MNLVFILRHVLDLIIRDLTRIKNKDGMNAHLSDYERGLCRAVDKLCEGSIMT